VVESDQKPDQRQSDDDVHRLRAQSLPHADMLPYSPSALRGKRVCPLARGRFAVEAFKDPTKGGGRQLARSRQAEGPMPAPAPAG
jgi:hypothetical protein